jgi:hypothetical protein
LPYNVAISGETGDQPVSYEETRRARQAAGFCVKCGAERTGEGFTGTLCRACAERSRAAGQAYAARHREEKRNEAAAMRKAWRAEGRCLRCGAVGSGMRAVLY